MKKLPLTLSILVASLLMFMNTSLFADGPEIQDPELAKKQLNECSDGITQTWRYGKYGYIFHGENLDRKCAENLSGVPSYDDAADYFIFRDNLFWFFIDEDSYGSSVKETKYGVVVQHSFTTHTKNFLIKNIFKAQNQDEIVTVGLYAGDVELHKDFYFSFGNKSYLTKEGGAFWFDTKRNYQNEIIELLNTAFGRKKVGNRCLTPEEAIKNSGFSLEELQKDINPNGLSSFWLAALTYHKKPVWCFSQ